MPTQTFNIPFGQWVNVGSGLLDISATGNAIRVADSVAAPDASFTGDCFLLPSPAARVRLNFTNAVWASVVNTEDNGIVTTVLATPAVADPALPIGEAGEEYTLAAGVPQVIEAEHTPISVQVKTGTTADVYTTCSTPEEVAAGTADWVEWTNGPKAGPFTDVVRWPCTALKLVSVAGGTVYLARSRP